MSKLHRDNAGYVGCSAEETQDPYYSFNKLALPLRGQINSVLREEVTFTVTVASAGGGNKYFIDGVQQASVTLLQGNVYTFDQSDNSNNNHPLRFSYTADGTHGGGTEITLGVTKNGTPGQSGAYTRIVVPFGLHDLKYYCGQHSGMGGAASVTSNPNMTTFGLPILKTTDSLGKTLGNGNNADPYAANLVLALPMNGTNGGTTFADQSAAIKGSGSAKTISVNGNTQTSTAQSQFYGSSAYLDGSSDEGLTIANNPDLDLGTGDFTVEFWTYLTTIESTAFVGKFVSGNYGWIIQLVNATTFRFYSGNNGSLGSPYDFTGGTVSANKWHHVALTRHEGAVTMYLDGNSIGAVSNSQDLSASTALVVGTNADSTDQTVNGYMSDLRIYKGVAKYTTPFPTGEYAFKAVKYDGNGGIKKIGGEVFSASGAITTSGTVIGNIAHPFAGRALLAAGNSTPSNSTYGVAGGTITQSGLSIPVSTSVVVMYNVNTGGNGSISLNGVSKSAPVPGSGNTTVAALTWTSAELSGELNSISATDTGGGSSAVYFVQFQVDGAALIDGDGSNILFSPGLVWTKGRNQPSNHGLYDVVRGTSKRLRANESATEDTRSGVTSFDPNGFTEGNFDNQTNYTYAAWLWNAGDTTSTVAAGSLNNTLYNQSTNWSSGASNSNMQNNWDTSFDGNMSNFALPNTGYASPTLTFSSAISYSTLELVVSRDIFAPDLLMNGSALNVPATDSNTTGGQYKIERFNFTNGTLTSIGHNSRNIAGRGGSGFWQIIVDGKILVNSSATPPNVPSIASTVRANPSAGFSITTYNSGSSSGDHSIGHGLQSVPKVIFHKSRSTGNWWVYHASVIDDMKKYLQLNSTNGVVTNSSAMWGASAPTNTTFGSSVGQLVGTSEDVVAYCWSEVPGYSKFGSYNSSSNTAQTITTGFKPAFVLIHGTGSGGFQWVMYDSARGGTNHLTANRERVENDPSGVGDITFESNGFSLPASGDNGNIRGGGEYIYMAFAESSESDAVYEAVGTTKVIETDLSSSAHAITNNGATFQTSVKKFYEGSAAFSGGQSIEVVSSDFDFGTADFTMECWVNFASLSANAGILDTRSDSNTNGFALLGRSSGVVQMADGTSLIGDSVAVNLNSWVHIAGVRQGSNLSLYYNGSPVGTVTNTTDFSNGRIKVGTIGSNSEHLNGYVQDVRVYKDIAKYTSSFSPPERSVQGTARRYPSGVYVVS